MEGLRGCDMVVGELYCDQSMIDLSACIMVRGRGSYD